MSKTAVRDHGPADTFARFMRYVDPLARLTEEDVVRIRDLAKGGQRRADIAERYGMSAQQISKIVRRENWSHVQ